MLCVVGSVRGLAWFWVWVQRVLRFVCRKSLASTVGLGGMGLTLCVCGIDQDLIVIKRASRRKNRGKN